MGAEAWALGHGGTRLVARAAAVREATVSMGVDELDSGAERLGRAWQPGRGAPSASASPFIASSRKSARRRPHPSRTDLLHGRAHCAQALAGRGGRTLDRR